MIECKFVFTLNTSKNFFLLIIFLFILLSDIFNDSISEETRAMQKQMGFSDFYSSKGNLLCCYLGKLVKILLWFL